MFLTPIHIAGYAREAARQVRALLNIMCELAGEKPVRSIGEVNKCLNLIALDVNVLNVAHYVGRNWTPLHKDRLMEEFANIRTGAVAFVTDYEFVRAGRKAGRNDETLHVNNAYRSDCGKFSSELV